MPLRMIRHAVLARVAELADARDSKSRGPLGRVGSTPTSGTRSLAFAGLSLAQELLSMQEKRGSQREPRFVANVS